MKTLKNHLKETVLHALGYCWPRMQVSLRYRLTHGRWIDWKHPRDIDEKIQWLKFYGDTSQWSRLADKYAVRDYIKEKGLGDILVPLIGKWDKGKDIPWESLPNQFVMKTNHGSGDALICTDKSQLDTAYYTRHFDRLLKEKFGVTMYEPHYDKIKPCIIAEELLDASKQDYPSSSPIDYKLWCFNGEPAFFFVCFNRANGCCDVSTYDTDWNLYPQYIKGVDHYHACDVPLPRPHCLEQMLAIAPKLTKDFPCVRLDLYEIDHKLYFGEMTFTPASGANYFYPQEFLDVLGNRCKLRT